MSLSKQKVIADPIKANIKPQKVSLPTKIPGLVHPSRVVVLGPSGKGKTSTMIALLYFPQLLRGFFNDIFLFSPSAYTDPKWLLLGLPKDHVFDTVSQINVLKIMSKCVKERNNVVKKGKGELPRYLIIFDDCGAEREMRGHLYANPVDFLTFNCRWLGISVWYGVQNLISLSVPVRTQADGIITRHPGTKLQIDTLFQNYGTEDMKEFKKMLKTATIEKDSFMFINRRAPQTEYYAGFKRKMVPPSLLPSEPEAKRLKK